MKQKVSDHERLWFGSEWHPIIFLSSRLLFWRRGISNCSPPPNNSPAGRPPVAASHSVHLSPDICLNTMNERFYLMERLAQFSYEVTHFNFVHFWHGKNPPGCPATVYSYLFSFSFLLQSAALLALISNFSE